MGASTGTLMVIIFVAIPLAILLCWYIYACTKRSQPHPQHVRRNPNPPRRPSPGPPPPPSPGPPAPALPRIHKSNPSSSTTTSSLRTGGHQVDYIEMQDRQRNTDRWAGGHRQVSPPRRHVPRFDILSPIASVSSLFSRHESDRERYQARDNRRARRESTRLDEVVPVQAPAPTHGQNERNDRFQRREMWPGDEERNMPGGYPTSDDDQENGLPPPCPGPPPPPPAPQAPQPAFYHPIPFRHGTGPTPHGQYQRNNRHSAPVPNPYEPIRQPHTSPQRPPRDLERRQSQPVTRRHSSERRSRHGSVASSPAGRARREFRVSLHARVEDYPDSRDGF